MSDADTSGQYQEHLDDNQRHICWGKGTEPPFTGKYWNTKTPGIYQCVCCGEPLFDSDTKYDSGSGWPSFYAPVREEGIREARDASHGMLRVEIMCGRCGSHLGHVFPDGPRPTGLRYCVNSASLSLVPRE